APAAPKPPAAEPTKPAAAPAATTAPAPTGAAQATPAAAAATKPAEAAKPTEGAAPAAKPAAAKPGQTVRLHMRSGGEKSEPAIYVDRPNEWEQETGNKLKLEPIPGGK